VAINYNVANNYIQVIGYSSGTPATFADIYAADLAGTYELLDGTIDADPDTFSLDDPVRPADSLAVQLTITCTARAGATCDIDGEDAWGNAISENGIDISSGSATTTEYFSVVDASGITVDGMTNGDDFDIEQDRWGVVWNQGIQYMSDARLVIGDHNPTTYFADKNVQVLLNSVAASNGQRIWQVSSNTQFTLGTLEDEDAKTTSDGVQIMINEDTYDYVRFEAAWSAGTVFNLYSTSILQADKRADMEGFMDNLFNVQANVLIEEVQTLNAFNLTLLRAASAFYSGTTLNKVLVLDSLTSGSSASLSISQPVTINDLTIRNSSGDHRARMINQNTDHSYLIDADLDVWDIYFPEWMSSSKKLYRQYTFDLKVVDATGTGIASATVAIADKDGNAISGSPFTTDASGDITSQVITHATYEDDDAGGLEVLFSPYAITISKAGHTVREIIYTIDRTIGAIEKLAGIPLPIEHRRRRVPGEVSELIER